MGSYLIGHIAVKDEKLWQEYVAGVQESLIPYQSKILFRGKLASVLAGKHEHNLAVVIEFQDQSTLDNWYSSEKYQSLIPIRDKAANVAIMTYNDTETKN
jgi:uncharacterized protein (DUF1330 family)